LRWSESQCPGNIEGLVSLTPLAAMVGSNVEGECLPKVEPLTEHHNGDARWCRHVNLLVDPDARIVWCKDCGEHLDPIDILVGYAKGEESRG